MLYVCKSFPFIYDIHQNHPLNIFFYFFSYILSLSVFYTILFVYMENGCTLSSTYICDVYSVELAFVCVSRTAFFMILFNLFFFCSIFQCDMNIIFFFFLRNGLKNKITIKFAVKKYKFMRRGNFGMRDMRRKLFRLFFLWKNHYNFIFYSFAQLMHLRPIPLTSVIFSRNNIFVSIAEKIL